MRTLAVILFYVVSIFSFHSAASAEDSVAGMLNSYAYGRQVPVTPKSILVMGGATDMLSSQCEDLNLGPADAQVLSENMQTAIYRVSLGGQYSGPLDKGLESQWSDSQVYLVAGKLAKDSYGCGANGRRLLQNMAASLRSSQAAGKAGTFVKSCSSRHSQGQCECLLSVGQAVESRLANQPYSSGLIRSIIKRNPMIGMQIVFRCGINRY